LHFITFSCYQRKPFLNSQRTKTVFVKILEEVRTRYQFSLVGYVLMPEHVHLLIGEPVHATPSKAVQVLKQRVSRAMRQRKRRKLASQLKLPFPRTKRANAILATTVL
jgi:putative transposase